MTKRMLGFVTVMRALYIWRMKSVLIAVIQFYRHTLSGVTGRRCRYLPTCSEYASDAIEKYGTWRGGLLAFSRISRCHPWGGEGFDPVPDAYQGPVWRIKKGVPKDP